MKKLILLAILLTGNYFVHSQDIVGDSLMLYKGASVDGDLSVQGEINANGNKVTNLAEPTDDNDAVRKIDLETATGNPDFIDFNIIPSPPAHNEGRLYYDDERSELVFYNEFTDEKFGVVSENSFKVLNNTATPMTKGQWVYPTGVSGGFTTIDLAVANSYGTSRPVGCLKTDISAGGIGFVTLKGTVEGVNTTGLSGVVYLSATTAGEAVNVPPSNGNFIIRLGAVKEIGTNGSIEVDPFTNEYTAEVIAPRGWADKSLSTISFDEVTRTLSLTGANYVYQDGIKYDFTDQDITWTDTEGLKYFYLEQGNLAVQDALTPSQVRSLYQEKPGVAYLYWDAVNDQVLEIIEKRHGFKMDGDTWAMSWDLHRCSVLEGIEVVDIDTDASGSIDASAQFGVNSGIIRNQDLITSTPAVGYTTGFSVYYRDGISNLRYVPSNGFPMITTGTGRLAYNENVGGIWQLTEVSNNDYVLCHVFVSNNITPVKTAVILGQNEYTSISDARDGALREINNLLLSGIITQEISPVATVIFQTSGAMDLYDEI